MANKGPRYRFILVREPETTVPTRYRRYRHPFAATWVKRAEPLETLLEAFLQLNRRSEGSAAWAPVLSENPLAFLLDAMTEAVIIRQLNGRIFYANPAAQRVQRMLEGEPLRMPTESAAVEYIQVAEQRYIRRHMTFGSGKNKLILEVLCKEG